MVGVKHVSAGLLLLLVIAALTLAGCGGGSELGKELGKESSAAPHYDLDFDGRTDKPAQVVKLAAADYSVEPLLTVADEIPLLTDAYPGSGTDAKRTFAFPGTPDGLGIKQEGDGYFVWCNHELGATNSTAYSDTVTGKIMGARVSLLKLDRNFSIIGGRNLISAVYDKTGLVGETVLSKNNKSVSQWGTTFERLCSATETDIYGQPLFLSGEETTNGRGLVIDTAGNATVISDFVKIAYENMVPVSKWDDQTVLLGLDDTSTQAYLVLYVGNRTSVDPLGFRSGTCYVAQVYVNGALAPTTSTLLINALNTVKWVQVPKTYDFDGPGGQPAKDLYNSSADYYVWAKTIAKATEFKRPEDGTENPKKPGEIHFVTTGRAGTYDEYGRVWELKLGGKPTKDGTIVLDSIGSPSYYMNCDNNCFDSFKNFWLQEDPSGTQGQMLAVGRRASVYRGPAGFDSYLRLFEVAQDFAPFNTYGIKAFKDDPWETSGIVPLPGVSAGKNQGVLFDTQAHGWPDPDYIEGGQLILAFPKGFILPNGRRF